MSKTKNWKPLTLAFLYTLLSGAPVLADDIEILVRSNTNSNVPANIVFIIDTSRSMLNLTTAGNEDNSSNNDINNPNAKINQVKQVFHDIIINPDNQVGSISTVNDRTNPANVVNYANSNSPNPLFKGKNFALMRFDIDTDNRDGDSDSTDGGYFLTELIRLDSDQANSNSPRSSRARLLEAVWTLDAEDSTPLSETLYEADRFFAGAVPQFGLSSEPANSTATVLENGEYLSPFASNNAPAPGNSGNTGNPNAQTCGTSNHVVLLSDGEPTNDTGANSLIPGCNNDGNNCLVEMASHMFNNDYDTTASGKQNVMVHTIAFDLQSTNGLQLLEDTANAGGGIFRSSNTTADLASAVEQIISSIQMESAAFTAPAVSIDSANKLLHDSTLYFSMFKPDGRPRWKGNLKGYQIQNNTLVDFTSPEPIAVLNEGGGIDENAKSKWSNAVDGAEVLAGGAASQSSLTRNVYTDISGNTLASTDNQVHENNTALSNAVLGVNTAAERTALLQWARGVDVLDEDADQNTTEARHVLGDPLHSQPIPVSHSDGNTYLFFGTNDGYVHAIDVSSGQEVFAFIPSLLLGNLNTLYDNIAPTQLSRPYGVDGNISVAKINNRTYLYIAFRRGARAYYALDISNMNNPLVAWKIQGGDTGYEELGQSWSQAVPAKVRLGNTEHIALIVGGGYDAAAEDVPPAGGTAAAPSMGRAVYIIDAVNGQRLWMAYGPNSNGADNAATRSANALLLPGLTSSVPATIATLDVNLDGFTDRLYFADISGKLHRVDLNARLEETDLLGNVTTTTPNVPNGGQIANLRGTNPEDQRRFYNEVEIVFTKIGPQYYISLNLGSGYRDNPAERVLNDTFFSIKDRYPRSIPNSYSVSTMADLVDITTAVNATALQSGDGWYLNLPAAGEKILSQSLTLNNKLMFTSYIPADPANMDPCAPPAGSARLYTVSLFDGTPVANDRSIDLRSEGIPPSPAVVFTDNGANANPGIKVLVGMEVVSNLVLEAVLQKESNWTVNPQVNPQ